MDRYKAYVANVGICSFARFPICEDLDKVDADVGVLGVPYDASIGWRPGARLGPRDIRNVSPRHSAGGPGLEYGSYYYDVYRKEPVLEGVSIVDCGDVDVAYTDIDRNHGLIIDNVKRLRKRGVFPVLLGGDHSISYPIVRAFDDIENLTIVHFDAHFDLHDNTDGHKYANSSPFARIAELPFAGRMIHIGIRMCMQSEYEFAINRGNLVVTREDVRRDGVQAIIDALPDLGDTYVSIDIDSLDPSVAPGTGSPAVDGLYYHELRELLTGVTQKGTVHGFDLVEVNPLLDPTGRTSLVAVRTVIDFLADIFAKRQSG